MDRLAWSALASLLVLSASLAPACDGEELGGSLQPPAGPQPSTHTAESGSERSVHRHRRAAPDSAQHRHRARTAAAKRLSGPNVCGGQQCCSGWAIAPGTNRCIKPDCQPPCQNKGSCSRPHICVCRSGFQGPRCEETAPEQVYVRTGNSRALKPVSSGGLGQQSRRRPSERQAENGKSQIPKAQAPARVSLTTATQTRRAPQDTFAQQSGTSRTVKRYPSSNTIITSNALPSSNGNGNGQPRGHNRASFSSQVADNLNSVVDPAGANLTASLDRIKIVFTPMVCRWVCDGDRCHNSCKKGDTTTIYSQNQNQSPPAKSQGFRLFFCQIPCMNGGRCIGRDECWCPSNSTGKFCHISGQSLPKPSRPKKEPIQTFSHLNSSSHSMYTLPLSNQQASLHPSLVNVHIQHPPEAGVQIHQVARVKTGQPPTAEGDSSTEGIHSVQQRSQPSSGNAVINDNGQSRPHNRQNGYVGRCFQETVDGQCGKPLPGLTKQEDCCGSVGASWGLNKCTECPPQPAYAVIANGQVECPKGYKRMNATHCQDINECLMVGICKNAECLNTRGSYRCTCKVGYMLDAARSHCVSDKAVSDTRSTCYRSSAAGICSLPLSQHITKQICCCSRVGKAWGPACERCPLPDTDHFKEICPAGHGYTYSRSDIQISLRQLEEEEEPRRPGHSHQTFPHPHLPQQPQTPQITVFQQPHHPPPDIRVPNKDGMDVVEKTTPSNPVKQEAEDKDKAPIVVSTQVTEVDRCSITPTICGPGVCVPVQTGYTCYCDPGYELDALQTRCIDVNECGSDVCEGKGRCVNTFGSYACHCYTGYSQVITQNRKSCQDVDECRNPSACPNGRCVNTQGSFQCHSCGSGFRATGGRCLDINECLFPGTCSHGHCVNTEGSYRCRCNPGFQSGTNDTRCQDVDECLLPGVCVHGSCLNLEGAYRCNCNPGYQASTDGKACEDVDECVTLNACFNGICKNTEGSYSCSSCRPGYLLSSDKLRCEDVDECSQEIVCPNGLCTNTMGSFICKSCHSGYHPSPDRKRCQDIDECLTKSICSNAICLNSEGSYSCTPCPKGYMVSEDGELCEDVDECSRLDACPDGLCRNTEGSFTCTACETGYKVSADGTRCEDIDECFLANVCPGQLCRNSPGSYSCNACSSGFHLSEDGYGCEDIDECLSPSGCPAGVCTNTEGSYTCTRCNTGYKLSADRQTCEDINECEDSTRCLRKQCFNTPGSYRCVGESGMGAEEVPAWTDVDECSKGLCSRGQCLNTDGSFQCLCETGFKFSQLTMDCEDMDECKAYNDVCGTWRCENTPGSYRCFRGCHPGEESGDCDIDECANETICGDYGFCENTDGSYRCQCDRGFTSSPGTPGCVDINECEMSTALCGSALCENVEGSFLCLCPSDNEEFDPLTKRCRIMAQRIPMENPGGAEPGGEQRKECYYNVRDANLCDNVLSRNTTKQECCCTVGEGWGDNCEIHPCPTSWSARFHQLCPNGKGLLSMQSSSSSSIAQPYKDVDECLMFSPEICKNGRCLNSYGSYSCQCRSGFQHDSVRQECVDIDECAAEDNCKDGTCFNTHGSFNCFCQPPLTLDHTFRRCIESSIIEGPGVPNTPVVGVVDGATSLPEPFTSGERKECYYNTRDGKQCDNVLSRNVTKQECCCTLGEAWGENCKTQPCPNEWSAELHLLCPHGKGLVPLESSPSSPGQQPYKDVDECELFSPEICRGGRCVNTAASHLCFCQTGFYHDFVRHECMDIDECEAEDACIDGACVNTHGSFNCFCQPPLTLDLTRRRCIRANVTGGESTDPDEGVYLDICWQGLTEDNICARPLIGQRTTYTECCCMYGVAWSHDCAFCPTRPEDIAMLCNLGGVTSEDTDSLRERPGYEYGPEGPESPVYWGGYGNSYYSNPGSEYGPADPQGGPYFGRPGPGQDFGSREAQRVPVLRPREFPFRLSESYGGPYDRFEGLQAEECGILNGCENGRCVRVPEGYTCECFDGYRLDLAKMACIDINECEDISDNVPLCRNGRCSNTEGSYNCSCLPGFVASPNPHDCIPEFPSTESEN